jgi:glutamine amidotransferase
MLDARAPKVAIVDYGLGNLFSVQRACEHVGLQAFITSSPHQILKADAVILPGVGAFGDAMASMHRLDLINVLYDAAASPKPFIGICLGMQLLMTESFEFGHHAGLGLIPGTVVRFEDHRGPKGVLKVPQVCWNRLYKSQSAQDPWAGSFLEGLPNGSFMYFVHSFYTKPENPEVQVAITRYGSIEFCSALRLRNIFACQFHPERSGPMGLAIYRNLASILRKTCVATAN